jgi:hypothetical protein
VRLRLQALTACAPWPLHDVPGLYADPTAVTLHAAVQPPGWAETMKAAKATWRQASTAAGQKQAGIGILDNVMEMVPRQTVVSIESAMADGLEIIAKHRSHA